MEKQPITNDNIGLFLSQQNLKERNFLTKALQKEGANVILIDNETDLRKALKDPDSARHLDAIVCDSNILTVEQGNDIAKADINVVAISFLPKGPRVLPASHRILEAFVQKVLSRELQPA